jgi:hypothetical protein
MGFFNNIFDKSKHLVSKNLNKFLVTRVYSEDELNAWGSFGFWETTDISGNEILIYKVLEHLKNSYNFKVYICRHRIIFSCNHNKYGKIKCNLSHSYSSFEFGILKSGERYYINSLSEYPQFEEYLKDKFENHILDYYESKNL